MTTSTSRRRLRGAALFALVALSAGALLFALNRASGRTDSIFSVADLFQELGPSLAFLIVGTLLVSRRPGNLVGVLCAALGFGGTLSWTLTQYAAYGLVTHPHSLPGALVIALATQNAWAAVIVLLVVLACVFPDGALLSPRWRIVPAATILGFAGLYAVGLTSAFSTPFEHVHNPLSAGRSPIVTVAVAIEIPIVIAALVGALANIVVRFRRSRGDERAQLKWLVFAASLLPVGIIAHSIADWRAPGAVGTVELLFSGAVLGFPIAIGIAVFKYRLYEINVIVRRTLIYGPVSALLAACYAGLVVLLQGALGSVTRGNELGVAGSTLVVAALFRPVLRRVQRAVDERFYRSKVDAEAMLAHFGERVRREAELDVLLDEIRSVVTETLAPEHVSLWLRVGVPGSRNDLETVTR